MKGLADKTTKVSLKNGYVQLENQDLRLPILSLTDQNDPGGMLYRCMDKVSPGQKRLYCKESSEEAKKRCRMFGYAKPSMHHLKPLGKTSITNGMKEIAKRLDLKDWESFEGQAFRALMATKLGNDASVNLTENMASLRHESASAHKSHNRKSGISETNKHKVLGIIKN